MIKLNCKYADKVNTPSNFVIVIAIFLGYIFFITNMSSAVDLKEAYELAKQNDPVYASAVYEKKAMRALSEQGLSYILPQISFSGSQNRYSFEESSTSDYTYQYYNINLRQPIFNLKNIYEYRQSNVRRDMGDAKFVSAEQELILRVTGAYLDILAAKDSLELVTEEKKAVAEQLEQSKKLFDAGEATLTDIYEADARYHDIISNEIDARNNLEIKKRAFSKITGINTDKVNRFSEKASFAPIDPESLEGWIDIAENNNPNLIYYRHNISFFQEDVKKSRAQHLPSIDFVAGYTSTNSNEYKKTNTVRYSSIGVQITIPLFSGGYVVAKTKESTARMEQAKKDYENERLDNIQKLSEAFWGIKSNLAKISALKAALKSAETWLYSTKMGFAAGIKTSVDVLNATKEFYNIKTKLMQSNYNYIINLLKLKSAAGSLSEKDIVMINNMLVN